MLEVEATSRHGHTANGSGENRRARRFVAICDISLTVAFSEFS